MEVSQQQRARILPRESVLIRDGVSLCTDVYLPEVDVARPAVVLRTPYGRSGTFLMRLALRLSQAGFCVVLQDCRGRYQSGGAFDLTSEVGDSRDTLAWVARNDWCDGRAGLIGISISGLPNLMVASEPPDPGLEIQALVNIMGAADYHSMFYRQGALVLHWALPWMTMMGSENMGRTDWQKLDWGEAFRHLPLLDAATRTGAQEDFWRLVVSYAAYGGFWKALNALEHLTELKARVLHLSGWRDFMLDQTLLAYSALAARGTGPGDQKLIVGPWDHKTLFSPAGAAEAGWSVNGEPGSWSLVELLVRWFELNLGDHARERAGAQRMAELPDVLLYVLETSSWIGVDTLPPPQAVRQEWYLASSDGAASAHGGGGRLVRDRPASLGMDSYDYDPMDPVPTVGGSVWPFPPANLTPGGADQSDIEMRGDLLVYTSEPLAEDLVAAGPVSVDLWAATSACDTDFTAKLVDVHPEGTARVVQDGIVRGRFHSSRSEETLLVPQQPYRFEIPMSAIAYRFRVGHRLRVEIASSNFPKFNRNLNTASPPHTARAGMVARQTVIHGGEMASHLVLYVLPAQASKRCRVEFS